MRTRLRKIGNSQGVLIPKRFLARLGLQREVELTVEDDAIVLRRALRKSREGWAEASKALAESGDDAHVMGEFANADDATLSW
jgi:antitoxin MazE